MLAIRFQSGVYTRVYARPLFFAFGCRDTSAFAFPVITLFILQFALLSGHASAQENAGNALEVAKQLRNGDISIRKKAIADLWFMGNGAKDAVPYLALALKDDAPDIRSGAAYVLGRTGDAAKKVKPDLVLRLNDSEENVRLSASYALGQIGDIAKDVIAKLIADLQTPDVDARHNVVNELIYLAKGANDARSIGLLPDLRSIYYAFTIHSDPKVRDKAIEIQRAIDFLEAINRISLQSIWKLICSQPFFSVGIAVYLLLPIIWILLLMLRPLLLLQASKFLSQFEPRLRQIIEVTIPVRHVLLITLFHYRPRVLDAWIQHYLGTARENFVSYQTVAQHRIHVTTPITISDKINDNFSAATLQTIFSKNKVTLLITGEGGAGKTSLACQLATWAMADESEQRLCQTHRMLPVLIEANLFPRDDKKDVLLEAVRGQLGDVIGETAPIFEELLLQLLRKRRVLVIVDSLSELDETTRKSVRPTQADFPVAALVVTSRIDEELGGASKTLLRPLRLKSDRLSTFMDRYLEQLGKRELFNDEEYFEACRQLSQLVSDREITVLIAKMYAEQMIAAKEADAGAHADKHELPRNLPDLMLGYVKRLNDQVKAERQDIRKVVNVAKIAAWECLKHTCRPTTAKRDDVIQSLSKDPDAETLLKYLEERLQLIQTIGPISDLIRFSLDPLAEYLAALYLVERCGKFEDLWQEFFENAEKQSGAPETIKSFLLAVRDCCVEKGDSSSVPEWVGDELARLAGLDPEVTKTAQLKQRIKLLLANLNSPHADDRKTAASALGEVGTDAKEAVPGLIVAFKDQVVEVRRDAAFALGRIGKEAAPALVAALKGQDAIVRRFAADALGHIGPQAKDAVPALIAALNDEDVETRKRAAMALGDIGPEAKDAVPALIAALKDESDFLRAFAASSLGQFGPHVKESVPALIAALKDQVAFVRESAARALGRIGSETKEAKEALVAALKDEDPSVRSSAADALGGETGRL